MPNILELQDDLKNFDDAQLTDAVNDPSGPIPQYLVLTEMNRRKNIRDSAIMQEPQPQTTIAEELSTQMSPYGAPPPVSAPEASAGFPALANASQVTGGGVPPGFANGGYVFDPNNPFMGIADQLGDMRDRNAKARADASNVALMNIGFGIAASKSPYFGQAVGEGGMAGMSAYRQYQKDLAGQEMDFLRHNLALAQAQQSTNLAAQQRELDERRLDIAERELTRLPANVRTMQWLSDQPKEVQDEYSRMFGTKGTKTTLKDLDKAATIYEDTANQMLKPLGEGGEGWADEFTKAFTDVEKASVKRAFNEAVYRKAAATNPARADQLAAIYQNRMNLEPDRGLNIVDGAGAVQAPGDIRTVPLSPLVGRRGTAPAAVPMSPMERQRALMEQIRQEQRLPAYEYLQGQWPR